MCVVGMCACMRVRACVHACMHACTHNRLFGRIHTNSLGDEAAAVLGVGHPVVVLEGVDCLEH